MQLSGIVLSGGKSTRMGSEKGLVHYNGMPMVSHVINALMTVSKDIVLIANDAAYSEMLPRVFQDEYHEKGPLAGIITGLRNTKHARSIVLACDIPCISPRLLAWMLDRCPTDKGCVLQFEGRMHPLIGIYRQADLLKMEARLQNNQLRMMDLVAVLNLEILQPAIEMEGFSKDWLQNFNSLADMKDC